MMNAGCEESDLNRKTVSVSPRHLLCLRCLNGGGRLDFMDVCRLEDVLATIRTNPDAHLKLDCAFDEIGARTPLFEKQHQTERKKDLDVLQKLGLVPGAVRTARCLFERIAEKIPEVDAICSYPDEVPGKWVACPNAGRSFYRDGGDGIITERNADEKADYKARSCQEIENADHLFIRAHHLLCIVCFAGGDRPGEPLEEDNLFELMEKMCRELGIPVTLTEGCSSCMVCPPCHGYSPERGICFLECALRDRKKDLDVLCKLGLSAGDTLPASELYGRIFEKIDDVDGICSYGEETSPEWRACQSTHKYGSYKLGKERLQRRFEKG